MRDGVEVTTLMMSRILPTACGITCKPDWTMIFSTCAAHLTWKCSPLKNISAPNASLRSFIALLLTLALSSVTVNSWSTKFHSNKQEVMLSCTAYELCGKEICLNAMIFFWSSKSSSVKCVVTPRYPKFWLGP